MVVANRRDWYISILTSGDPGFQGSGEVQSIGGPPIRALASRLSLCPCCTIVLGKSEYEPHP
jgi:hypothetical protein